MDIGPVDYNGSPPTGYRCANCGKNGVKLWRQFAEFLSKIRLLCASCATKDQDTSGYFISDGRFWDPTTESAVSDFDDDFFYGFSRTFVIGRLVPAIPDEDGITFWGYVGTPPAGVHWWKRLPIHEKSYSQELIKSHKREKSIMIMEGFPSCMRDRQEVWKRVRRDCLFCEVSLLKRISHLVMTVEVEVDGVREAITSQDFRVNQANTLLKKARRMAAGAQLTAMAEALVTNSSIVFPFHTKNWSRQ